MASPHAVVVGTGAGGLAAAAYLAKEGFEVTALEQAEQLGGYLNPFSRQGFQFDVGLHYVGDCRPGQLTYELLAGLGLDPGALFRELDPDGFDVYRFPDFEVRRCRGLDAYQARLAERFPEDARGLARFFDLGRRLRSANQALIGVLAGERGARWGQLRGLATWMRWSRRTFGELLEATVLDARLRSVLAAQSGTYGLPPGRASALAALQAFLHYADGGFYPRGGSRGLRDALVSAAEQHGARFHTRARVERLLFSGHRVAGVELADGTHLPAEVVVSDADPVSTFTRLVDVDRLPAGLRHKVQRIEPSTSTAILYLGLNRAHADGLGERNLWSYPGWDLDRIYAPLFAREIRLDELPPRPALFVSAPSARDPSGRLAPPGGSTLEVLTFSPYAAWERWSAAPLGMRGTEYETAKREVALRILAELERQLPGAVREVAVQELSTPLTNEGYTLAPRGGAYGPAEIPSQSGLHRFGCSTPIPNLFLTGAGAMSEGIAGCLLAGRLSAQLAREEVARHRPSVDYAAPTA